MKLSESPSRFGSRSALLILAVALLFSAFVRWRLREMPLERDEGGMAYMAQLLLQGIPPYQEAYHEKLPGIYLAYAALMAAFGQSLRHPPGSDGCQLGHHRARFPAHPRLV